MATSLETKRAPGAPFLFSVDLLWTHDKKTQRDQAARDWWQRIGDIIFMVVPKEYY